MMKKTIYISIFSLLVLLSGCKEYLDVEPKGEVIPTTVEELGLLLVGGKSGQTIGFGARSYLMMSDEFSLKADKFSSLMPIHERGYLWQAPFNVGDEDFDWRNFYYHIYLCNYTLSLIDDASLSGLTEKDRGRVKATALTIRAYSYFELVNVYGAHYNPTTAATDMAVPMLLVDDIEARLPRSNVEDIYNQITGDLIMATELFSSDLIPEVKNNASKTAAYGILSRVYLYMAEWENAEKYASLALANHSALNNYSDFIDEPKDAKSTDPINAEDLIFRRIVSQPMTTHEAILSDELKNLFEPGDLRFTFFTDTDGDGNTIYANLTISPMSGISTQEVYLNRAEANARLGNNVIAMDDLNTIRLKRFEIAPAPLTASTQQEAVQKVLDERQRELMFMGLRWYDMKRLIVLGEYTKTLTRSMGGETVTLEPGSDKYVVEISPTILEWNDNL
jgi:hypothetical protein